MSDAYTDLLMLILARLDAIEAKLGTSAPVPVAAPVQTGGLYDFVRPAVRDVSPWLDREMREADANEALHRALHGVNWRGGYIADSSHDEAWVEIERLKAGDQKLIPSYSYLDPEFAGF